MSTAPPTATPFTAILSTAGSRKTTQLTQLAVTHILSGNAAPEEALLTTLTRSAAAQLHERSIEQFLVGMRAAGGTAADFLDNCHRLEHAAIGTLHSLGLEVLHRQAVQTGLPARLRVLSAPAEQRLREDLLVRVSPKITAELNEYACRLGRNQPKPRRTKGVAFIQDVHDVLELRRRLRITSRQDLITACISAIEELAAKLEPTHKFTMTSDEPLDWYLNDLVAPHSGSKSDGDLCDKIVQRGFWGALSQLKHAKNQSLSDRAPHIHSAHWFHKDSVVYATMLAKAAHAVAVAYRKEKRRRGLVDYQDLADALHRYGWPDDLGFVGCDEVQDLTARQIRTAERLVAGTRHPQAMAVWVGDENQHLFGYQGASWNAAESAIGRLSGAVTPVHANHRSSPLLVAFFNALFGSKRPAQTAGRTLRPGEVTHLERWTLTVGDQDDQGDTSLRDRLTMPDETRALAAGIADLLARRSHIKASDIAVVVRTNLYADHVIQALHELGIPVDASPRSLAETREGRIAVEALRLLVDPSDALAAAVISHLLQDWGAPTDPTDWFWTALRAGSPDRARISIPGLSDLVQDRSLASRLSPAEAVQRVIAALGLTDRVAAWGGAAGRLRNLDGIVAVARAYETRCHSEQRPATIAGLAAVFDADTDEEESPHHARVATGGVTVTTTHSAKGLGWPVTIVGQGGWQPATGSSTFVIRDYEHKNTHGRIIRRPHVLPWAFGSHAVYYKDGGTFSRHAFLPHGALRADLHQGPYGTAAAAIRGSRALFQSDEEAERNNVFVACTRAESILVFTDPRSTKIKDSARFKFLQPILDFLLPPRVPAEVPRDIPRVSVPGGLDYTRFDYSPKPAAAVALPPGAVVSAAAIAATIQGFKALQHSDPYALEYPPADGTLPPPDGTYPRRYWKPSDEPPTHGRGLDPAACSATDLGTKPLSARAAARITRANDTLVGDVIHSVFAALPSLADLAPGAREDAIERIAARCIAAGGHDLPLDAVDLRDRVLAFEKWLTDEGLDVLTELPLAVERTAMPSTFWRGRIDALGVPRSPSPSGSASRIIDHKSATGFTPEWLAAWAAETGAYANCVRTSIVIDRIGLHLPLGSQIISLQ